MSEGSRPVRIAAVGIILAVLGPSAASAQIDTTLCEASASPALCRAAAELAAVMTVRAAIVAAGGNPVAGTASTLGRRMPRTPRLAFAVRRTSGSADLPASAGSGSTTATAWSGEIAVGLFDGLSPMSTVGGLFSFDLLASASLIQFPSADGFRTRAPSSFALGARLGLLRESFTMPGVAVSAMVRRTGRTSFGDIGLETRDLYVRLDRTQSWSARAVVGKRIGLFGFTVGAGSDHHSSRGAWRVPGPAGVPAAFEFRSLEADRRLLFAGAAWTLLVFNFSGEFGWQADASSEPGVAGNGGAFFGLAARMTF